MVAIELVKLVKCKYSLITWFQIIKKEFAKQKTQKVKAELITRKKLPYYFNRLLKQAGK